MIEPYQTSLHKRPRFSDNAKPNGHWFASGRLDGWVVTTLESGIVAGGQGCTLTLMVHGPMLMAVRLCMCHRLGDNRAGACCSGEFHARAELQGALCIVHVSSQAESECTLPTTFHRLRPQSAHFRSQEDTVVWDYETDRHTRRRL